MRGHHKQVKQKRSIGQPLERLRVVQTKPMTNKQTTVMRRRNQLRTAAVMRNLLKRVLKERKGSQGGIQQLRQTAN